MMLRYERLSHSHLISPMPASMPCRPSSPAGCSSRSPSLWFWVCQWVVGSRAVRKSLWDARCALIAARSVRARCVLGWLHPIPTDEGPPASRAVSSMQAHGRGRVHVALRLLRRLLPLALPRSSGLRTSPHPALRPTSHSVCMVSPPPRCSRAHTAPPRHCRGPRRSWEKWATGSAPRALRQQRRRRRQGREGRPRSPRARPSQPKPNQPRPSQPSPSQPSHQSSQPTPPTQPSHRQPSQPTPPTQPSQVTASASHSHSAVHLHVHPHGVHLWL